MVYPFHQSKVECFTFIMLLLWIFFALHNPRRTAYAVQETTCVDLSFNSRLSFMFKSLKIN